LKIDLHCHTKKTKKGDSPKRNVTPELFKEKVELADVKIVAITNHNVFDYAQYVELKNIVANECQVWPGVEIDVNGETNYHLIVIVKPDEAIRFAKSVDLLFVGETPDNAKHTIEEVYQAFEGYEALYIPHFHDKRPAISENDRDKLISLVNDDSRIFIEPRNYRTLGVLANKDFSVLIGSDVQNWDIYEKSTFADLRLPVKSFSEFLLLSRRDKKVVRTLLGEKKPINVIGCPHPSVKLKLSIYPEINVIFGAKGTGKTKLLESVCKDMQGKGYNCKIYIASDRSEKFEMLTDIKDMDIDLEKLGLESCEEEFQELKTWKDTNPCQFSNYLNWLQTKGNSNNKQRMKITEAVHLSSSKSDTYSIHKKNATDIAKVESALAKIDMGRYISEKDTKLLSELFQKLSSAIKDERKADLIDEYAIKLANKSIDQIKEIADRSSDTVSRPSTAGYAAFVECRMHLYCVISKILKALDSEEYNEIIKIGSLDGKGNIYVNCKYRMICDEERTSNYPGYKITILREIKEALIYIRNHFWMDDIASNISELNRICEENNIISIKSFIGRSKQIVTEDGNEYQPSNGEKGILLLEHTLQNDADAYFLDEPELGMGNSYIDTDIRPMITKLAQKRKFVVVATHNANIAVRTLPYMSIFRIYENGIYKTYTGNPFDDQLVNIDNKKDIRSWTEDSMHSLEGGRDAFYERRDIYESKDN